MTPMQVEIVQRTWKVVEPLGTAVGGLFYERLFALDPSVRALFPDTMTAQNAKLVTMLATAVRALDRPAELLPAVRTLGRRHAGYGVRDGHYASVGAALLETLECAIGAGFDATARAAWATAYGLLSETMREGAVALAPATDAAS